MGGRGGNLFRGVLRCIKERSPSNKSDIWFILLEMQFRLPRGELRTAMGDSKEEEVGWRRRKMVRRRSSCGSRIRSATKKSLQHDVFENQYLASSMARHSTFNEVQAPEVRGFASVLAETFLTRPQVGNLPLLPIKCASRTSPAGIWTGGDAIDCVDEAITVFRANVFYRCEN